MEVTYKAKIQLLQNEIHQLTTKNEEIELYYSQSKNEILSLQETNKKLKTDSAAYLSQLSSIESNSRQQIEEIRAQLEIKKKQVVDFEEKELKWRGERATLEGIIKAGKEEIEGKMREIAEVYQLVEERKSEIEVTAQNVFKIKNSIYLYSIGSNLYPFNLFLFFFLFSYFFISLHFLSSIFLLDFLFFKFSNFFFSPYLHLSFHIKFFSFFSSICLFFFFFFFFYSLFFLLLFYFPTYSYIFLLFLSFLFFCLFYSF